MLPSRVNLDARAITKNLVIPLSFILPIVILYFLEPDSFQSTWKGRTLYLFFLWLFFLELILAPKTLEPKKLISPQSSEKLKYLSVLGSILSFVCTALPWWSASSSLASFNFSPAFPTSLLQKGTEVGDVVISESGVLANFVNITLGLMIVGGIFGLIGLRVRKSLLFGALAILGGAFFLICGLVQASALGLGALLGTDTSYGVSWGLSIGFYLAIISAIILLASFTRRWSLLWAVIPTVSVMLVSTLSGHYYEIVEMGKLVGVQYKMYGEGFLYRFWPLSFEYLLLATFFTASIELMHGIKGLKQFIVCLFFLWATGSFYMMDTFYPGTAISALQSLVPFTASSAVRVLGWMGYGAELVVRPNGVVLLLVAGLHGGAVWGINWPCAGVHSLFIYTLVILLFVKHVPFFSQRKILYASIPRRLRFIFKNKKVSFLTKRKTIQTAIITAKKLFADVLRMVPIYVIVVIGAAGTFIVNVLRIVSICIIGSEIGNEAGHLFHSNYGQLYFIGWITIYLAILVLLNRRIQGKRLPIQGQAAETAEKPIR